MEDVGNRVLNEFAQRLEQEIAPEGAPTASTADTGAGRLPPTDDALDIGAALAQTAAARTVRRAAPIVVALLALLIFWRRRR
jgi:hypothetical protein